MFDGIRMRWENAQRPGEEKAAANADAARKRIAAEVNSLRQLNDDELIANVSPHTGSTPPREEMEMQRRLKDAI